MTSTYEYKNYLRIEILKFNSILKKKKIWNEIRSKWRKRSEKISRRTLKKIAVMIYKIQHAFNSWKIHMILWDIIKIIFFYSRTRVNIKYPHHDSSPFCSSIVCLSLFPLITSYYYFSFIFFLTRSVPSSPCRCALKFLIFYYDSAFIRWTSF